MKPEDYTNHNKTSNFDDLQPIQPQWDPDTLHVINPYGDSPKRVLNRSVCVPSMSNSYSLAIEFMREWFLTKFTPGTFKSIYVENRHTFLDLVNKNSKELLQKMKPALAITHNIDVTFDDDRADNYPYGLSMFALRGKMRSGFFRNFENDSYMGLDFETLLFNFGFRMKFETRAQQLDFYKFIKIAYRVGSTWGLYTDLDFHIPYELMIQLAQDNGFEVIFDEHQRGHIKDIKQFLNFINSKSALPFLYKYRGINGHEEFFIRMDQMYVHIRCTDLSIDEGEREGQMYNNFGIELSTEVRFPAPKMYAYFSSNEHKLDTLYHVGDANYGTPLVYSVFHNLDIPKINDRKWQQYLTTTYEDETHVQGTAISIDFNNLFEGDIGNAIEYCIDTAVSPAIFIDIWIYGPDGKVSTTMDWAHRILTTSDTEATIDKNCYISIYVDLAYMNNVLVDLKQMDANRTNIDSLEKDASESTLDKGGEA